MSILSYKLLTESQCDKVIEDANSLASRVGLLYGDTLQDFEINTTQYKAREAFLDLLPPFDWLYGVMQSALDSAAIHYGLSSQTLVEMPRLLTYEIESHFDWHVDTHQALQANGAAKRRRLTGSIQLSAPADYCGGELLIMADEQPLTASTARGNVTLFPADWRHKVCHVKTGTRKALVFWGYA